MKGDTQRQERQTVKRRRETIRVVLASAGIVASDVTRSLCARGWKEREREIKEANLPLQQLKRLQQ